MKLCLVFYIIQTKCCNYKKQFTSHICLFENTLLSSKFVFKINQKYALACFWWCIHFDEVLYMCIQSLRYFSVFFVFLIFSLLVCFVNVNIHVSWMHVNTTIEIDHTYQSLSFHQSITFRLQNLFLTIATISLIQDCYPDPFSHLCIRCMVCQGHTGDLQGLSCQVKPSQMLLIIMHTYNW